MTAAVTSMFVIIITCVSVIQVMQEQTRDYCAWLVGRLNLFNAGSAVSEKALAATEIPGSGGRGRLGY